MYDIHHHLLPGLDDGAADMDVSVAMAKVAVADGITHVACSPHANGTFPYERDANEKVLESLRERLGREGIALTLGLGCDFHLSYDNVKAALATPQRYTINGLGYLLVELPDYGLPRGLTETFYELRLAGMTPILTHPERNPTLQADPARMADWLRAGLLVQVTADTVTGKMGKQAEKMAHQMLAKRWVHFLATDAHNTHVATPTDERSAADGGKEIRCGICRSVDGSQSAGRVRGSAAAGAGSPGWLVRGSDRQELVAEDTAALAESEAAIDGEKLAGNEVGTRSEEERGFSDVFRGPVALHGRFVGEVLVGRADFALHDHSRRDAVDTDLRRPGLRHGLRKHVQGGLRCAVVGVGGPGMGAAERTDVDDTAAGLARRCGRQARDIRNGPRVLEANMASHSAAEMASRGAEAKMPALLTRISRRPSLLTAEAVASAMLDSSVRSQKTAHPGTPNCWIAPTVASASGCEDRKVMATEAPWAAKPSAMARPIRLAAPVTRTD